MLRTRTLLTTLALLGGLGLPLLATPPARAGLIPNKVTVLPDGSDFRWTYNVVITSDVYVRTGDFFTIYDFAGAINGSIVAPDGWSVSSQNVGVTPGKTNPADDPNIPNYTFTYTGKDTLFGQLGLGNFAFVTPYSHTATSDFTSSTHRQDNDDSEHNITATVVPVASASANSPEPATLALAVAGLPLAGLLRLRRRRQS
jgi:hypothetical protein